MKFNNSILEKWFLRFKWTRANTIAIFDEAKKNNILEYKLKSSPQSKSVLYQFQCIITTTDAQYRRVSGEKNKQFGILVSADEVVAKEEIKIKDIKKLLKEQLVQLEELFEALRSKSIVDNSTAIFSLSEHEYIHQGELMLFFRGAEVAMPERVEKAWSV